MEMEIFILYYNFYTMYITYILKLSPICFRKRKEKKKVKLYSFINKK